MEHALLLVVVEEGIELGLYLSRQAAGEHDAQDIIGVRKGVTRNVVL